MSFALRSLAPVVTGLLLLAPAFAAKEKPEEAPQSFEERIAKLQKRSGLLDFYPDPANGSLWLEVPPATGPGGLVGRFIYVEGLVTGLGSNPVGLDRGQLGPEHLVALRRIGNRLLVEAENFRFRALTEREPERLAARQSFATSVLWAGEIEAVSKDGRALVNLAPFLLRDAHGVVATLRETEQGAFELDPERSVVDFEACLGFPDNLEFEALLTYAGDDPGEEVWRTAADGEAFTLVQHHSLIRLPPPGYRPRVADPRAGSYEIAFQDYAAPLDGPLEKRWIARHRLAAGDTLTYYVDPGAPEPVRSALVEGASWWAQAFDAAGLEGTFRVELLPADVHPLDVRYNVIQWVHRETRGWSYGGGVTDPRTGEIIKGHVNLGSLRVRQDRRIFEGLLGTEKTGSGEPDDPVELSLARLRQLSAHEVGHTLGLAHNFAASARDRSSVMDYPAPLIRIAEDGSLDAGDAYAVGVGDWDLFAIRFAYAELAPESEKAGLEAMVRQALDRGLVMITDEDARPAGAALPMASLWDNGPDAVEQLDLEMAVRRAALDRFGERNVLPGEPLALLEETLATLYLHHRYQLEAAVKAVGGMDYRYSLRGDGQGGAAPLPAAVQRRALASVLATLDVAALDLPESVLALLLPRPLGYPPNREQFASATAPAFDALGAAATAADLAAAALLQPERAARLVDFHRRDAELPGLVEVIDALIGKAFGGANGDPRSAAIRGAVQAVVVDRLIELAESASATAAVRSSAEGAMSRLAQSLAAGDPGDHAAYLARQIGRSLNREAPSEPRPGAAAGPPPGSPIGAARATGLGPGCGFARGAR